MEYTTELVLASIHAASSNL